MKTDNIKPLTESRGPINTLTESQRKFLMKMYDKSNGDFERYIIRNVLESRNYNVDVAKFLNLLRKNYINGLNK